MRKVFFAVVSIFVVSFLCLPQGHAGRPLTTDDAWTVEKGKFQLETGFEAARQDNRDWEYSPSLALTYGISERVDLGIGSGYTFLDPKEGERVDGLADTEVKLKYRLVDEKGLIPAFALAGKIKMPTASSSKGLGSGMADFTLNAAFTKNLSKQWALHLNVGYTFMGDGDSDNELNYSLAAQYAPTEKLGLVGEFVGINNLNGRKGDDPLSWLVGAYYLITENIVWDAGVEAGLNSAAPDFRLMTGLTLFF